MQGEQYLDVQNVPHVVFSGCVPRDLDVDDTFEDLQSSGIIALFQVTEKKEKDGRIIVFSKGV